MLLPLTRWFVTAAVPLHIDYWLNTPALRAMSPSTATNILDHLVHLAPSVQDATKSLSDLGFSVLPGGSHVDGLTENALIVFSDGAYIELISFVHEPSYYPPGSPERAAREQHRFAGKLDGWIDYGFLGNGALLPPDRVSDIVNARASAHGAEPIYEAEVPGGRTRPDGVRLDWAITPGRERDLYGILPFFCGDITDRALRVPSSANKIVHPVGAQGISGVRVVVDEASFDARKAQFTDIIGADAQDIAAHTVHFPLAKAVGGVVNGTLILSTPVNELEREFLQTRGSGLYEVQIRVDSGRGGSAETPFGRIKWDAA